MRKLFIGICFIGLASVHLYGKKKGRTSYGLAGCGLGSILIKKDTMPMQVIAATLNATGYQMFAITTGTSNCKPSNKTYALEQKAFLKANFASIQREAARGEGDSLYAFAELLGCSDRKAFMSFSQKSYQKLFTSQDIQDVLARYRQHYPHQCSHLPGI